MADGHGSGVIVDLGFTGTRDNSVLAVIGGTDHASGTITLNSGGLITLWSFGPFALPALAIAWQGIITAHYTATRLTGAGTLELQVWKNGVFLAVLATTTNFSFGFFQSSIGGLGWTVEGGDTLAFRFAAIGGDYSIDYLNAVFSAIVPIPI